MPGNSALSLGQKVWPNSNEVIPATSNEVRRAGKNEGRGWGGSDGTWAWMELPANTKKESQHSMERFIIIPETLKINNVVTYVKYNICQAKSHPVLSREKDDFSVLSRRDGSNGKKQYLIPRI
jgi:hypothetical protein